MQSKFVTFDEGPLKTGTTFAAPEAVISAWAPEDVEDALTAMAAAQENGKWLAGFASYELGYAFSAKLNGLMPAGRKQPLLQFGVFDAPEPASTGTRLAPVSLSAPQPAWSFDRYAAAFAKVKDYISVGDTYQINLTFPMHATAQGAPADLYAALKRRQPVRYGAMVSLGGDTILSRSPELFFEIGRGRVITTRPMKGTAPRGTNPAEDAARKAGLGASVKDRAENLMIVDLLRNDVGRISQIGTVKVPQLFHVETYATVHQMTSKVQATLREDVGLSHIFKALFPCGSITGAPKIRAMQIIAECEDTPRDVYCGAVGWIGPQGDMCFNVAIRTLIMGADGAVRLNVGGGVVYDSTASGEYEEALWKARFATVAPTT